MTLLAQFAATGGALANYIEDVFSTWTYTGTGAALTITNNIDLSTKGGLVWIRCRSTGRNNSLYDTVRGANLCIFSNLTNAQFTDTNAVNSFTSTGFTLGAENRVNASADTYASWTFREQAKFFDVVTWTGTGANRTIAHALGSVPGCIIVKRTDTTGDWQVYHRSLANTEYLVLNTTAAVATGATRWNSTTATSTEFSLGTDATVNASAGTYVAYLWAHDAGGFGLAGTDNVISCGTATTNGSGLATVTLGYEPQWLLVRNVAGGNWLLTDNMREWAVDASGADNLRYLAAETNGVEAAGAGRNITSTGFNFTTGSTPSSTYIYIAIRRGPMKVPTSGTTVYNGIKRVGTGTTAVITGVGFTPDLISSRDQSGVGQGWTWMDRLRGLYRLSPNITTAEVDVTGAAGELSSFDMNGYTISAGGARTNFGGVDYINYFFGRAPGFFDTVCYTGTGSNTTQTHNLGVVPELIIVKGRSSATAWDSYSSALANTEYVVLNTTAAKATGATRWNSTTPTASVFSIGTSTTTNANLDNYVAYLFATCAGVSKVGSYTGTGTTQTINCGFTAGSRFVMIKRTDSTGDWYIWDSARGIVAGNDPYLLLNSTAAEVTSTDYVDTAATGFELSSTAPAAINASAGTFIFLAIA